MNSSGLLRDVITMVHEGGHAIHSMLTRDLGFVAFKELPSEVAELASMSMELISMEHWHHFFTDKDELRRAKREQLENIIEEGTEVRKQLDNPITVTDDAKRLHGSFRKGDIRWTKQPQPVTQVYLRPDQPPMYHRFRCRHR